MLCSGASTTTAATRPTGRRADFDRTARLGVPLGSGASRGQVGQDRGRAESARSFRNHRTDIGSSVTPRPNLAPIEALLAAPPPTTLEALGRPGRELSHDSTYQTTEAGARLDVGATLYPNGFQVPVDDFAMLTWPTHDGYRGLSAQIGEDELGKRHGGVVTISFYGSHTTLIPFYDRGKLVLSATIPMTGFISLSLPLAHLSDFRMSFSAEGYNVIDVVNDHLS